MLPDGFWTEWLWWIKAIGYALFASFGGVMGHLMRTIDGKHQIRWGRAVLEGGAAGFVGLLVLLLCQAMNLSEAWTGVIVGVAGWLGANVSIGMLEKVVLKKLGIQKPSDQPETRNDSDTQ